MNSLLQQSAIVLFALCQAVVSIFGLVSAAAEQPDAAQHHYERGIALLKKGDLIGKMGSSLAIQHLPLATGEGFPFALFTANPYSEETRAERDEARPSSQHVDQEYAEILSHCS